ncbi:MAPEG family protein [Halioglobus japonicus]|uniref:MAPEG family protein n=2 Tax=Halioglobus japonicus TaxID=930805 RepID=A0AAP8MHD3_9GAMM|nr:MAPEG family protein [Halioglobus japonicus]
MESEFMEISAAYVSTIHALGVLGAVMLCQLLLADIIGIRRGHVPGALAPADHDDLLFRASRTVANINESIAIFIVAVGFCVASGASPSATAYAAWGFVGARVLYAVCYYANLKLPRSAVFALSLVAIAALLIIGFTAH